MAEQSRIDTSTDLMIDEAATELRSLVQIELSNDELPAIRNELLEFFTALGELNDEPEESGNVAS